MKRPALHVALHRPVSPFRPEQWGLVSTLPPPPAPPPSGPTPRREGVWRTWSLASLPSALQLAAAVGALPARADPHLRGLQGRRVHGPASGSRPRAAPHTRSACGRWVALVMALDAATAGATSRIICACL